jgi:hypothetical protein
VPQLPEPHWVCARLSGDSLAPAIAWLLYVENPWSFLRFDLTRDRARVLEESWERAWPAAPGLGANLLTLSAAPDTAQPHVPVLVFNGTSVESGCRVNTSVLKANGRDRGEPATRCLSATNPAAPDTGAPTPGIPSAQEQAVLGATVDLVDFLCVEDALPLSKVALLSARFPLFSPSGHVSQCAPSATTTYPPETYIVDGGYLENSGAATATEIWAGLEPYVAAHNQDPALPAIIPFFIQIDNGYDQPSAPGGVPSQPQLIVPLTTVYGTTLNGQQAMAHQAAEIIFSQPFIVDGAAVCGRYAHFTLRAHPGPEAPLGWTLAYESFADLVDQFINTPAGKAPSQQVEGWFGQLDQSKTACPT